MKDGFLRVACATPNIRVADTGYNSKKIIDLIKKAEKENTSLVVFPELCVTGYTCGDLFLQERLLESTKKAIKVICSETKKLDIIAVIGFPFRWGNLLYNCAGVIYKGKVLGVVPKVNIPNYAEFYEKRYFSSFNGFNKINLNGKDVPFGNKMLFNCVNIPEFKFGVEICEDLWAVVPPSCHLASCGANLIVNLSASNEFIGKSEQRRELVRMQSSRLVCAYAYASAGLGESTSDLVFSGHNIIAEGGIVLKESQRFSNEIIYSDIDLKKIKLERCRLNGYPNNNDVNNIFFEIDEKELKLSRKISKMPYIPIDVNNNFNEICDEILTLQASGLATRLIHLDCKTVVIGLSGGLDSTLALIACVRTFDNLGLDKKGIIAVTMPCFGTSDRTLKNAKNLAMAYNVTFREIDIKEDVEKHFKMINHKKDCLDITYENAQARERTQILMDIANQEDGIVIGTGNLSELALGWLTYNGDHMSMYAINASVPKTLAKHIVKYEALHQTIGYKNVLDDILKTPISPELLPNVEGKGMQSTEKTVGPCILHDFFLYYFLNYGFSPKKIFRLAVCAFNEDYKPQEIKKWLAVFIERFFSTQFKRSCLPDSPKVCPMSLSPRGDFRMPSDASVSEWINEVDKIKV